MAGDNDPPWEEEFSEDDKPTEIDKRAVLPAEAIPTAVSTRDTTGKYKTLSYGVDVQSELAFGRGCAHCTKKTLMALKLWMMSLKVDHDTAQARLDRFVVWMHDPKNAELIRVALEKG